jgi:hypothetical protein
VAGETNGKLDQKIETVRQELKGEIRTVILMNRRTIEYLVNLIRLMR